VSKPRLLIVEDDPDVRTQLRYAMRDDYEVSLAGDRAEAVALLREVQPPVVSLDLGLPPEPDGASEGLKTLEAILQAAPLTRVVVVTGNRDRTHALTAVHLGAFDYHLKPIDLDEYRVVVRRAVTLHGLEEEAIGRARAAEAEVQFEEILGSTPRMREIFASVVRVARSDATVLIEGESGTGKELIARAMHARSPRAGGPFVPINCGAITETLLEAELFGHERGAFTGAHVRRPGRLEMAARGTVFLDEVGEMSPPLQVKLLRFLQEREIERVGGRERIRLDVRVVAATNKTLKDEIEAGRFREDLYYRLSVVTLHLPPLRERGEDVLVLASAFLGRSARRHGRRLRFAPAAISALTAHPWPGNIRELENTVERAVLLARDRLITAADLGLDGAAAAADAPPSWRETKRQAERQALLEALARTRGNVSQAARELGLSRPMLHELIIKHRVSIGDFRRAG
jgi:two-component system NtrC family response regulator